MHCLLDFIGLESVCDLKLILTGRDRSARSPPGGSRLRPSPGNSGRRFAAMPGPASPEQPVLGAAAARGRGPGWGPDQRQRSGNVGPYVTGWLPGQAFCAHQIWAAMTPF